MYDVIIIISNIKTCIVNVSLIYSRRIYFFFPYQQFVCLKSIMDKCKNLFVSISYISILMFAFLIFGFRVPLSILAFLVEIIAKCYFNNINRIRKILNVKARSQL